MSEVPAGGKVLIVEDNDFVRMQIARYLNDASYETIEASDGGQALKLIDTTFDLAIVDVRMEPMDGFEFIKGIRGRNIHLPIILVTGDQNPDLLSEANKWSVSAVLMKPVQKERLVSMATRAIERSKK